MQLKREFNLEPKHIRIFLFATVVILSLLLIVAAFKTNNLPGENIPEVSNDTPQLDFLPMDDNTRIDFPNARIQLPVGWSVVALLTSPTGTGYGCVGAANCRVALVAPTVEESNITEVIFSTPVYVRVEQVPELEKNLEKAVFGGEPVDLTADKSTVTSVSLDEEGNVTTGGEVSSYTYQIYGCHSKEVCVYASHFSDDPAMNALQVEEIKRLLSELTFL